MLTNTTRVKHKESEDEDMLSDLPDCVLLHILSLLDTKYAVQTCILSSRWKHLWKRLPTLILRTFESSTRSFTKLFSTCNSFTKFVSRVLSRRDGSIALYALEFDRTSYVESPLLKRIVKYAVSHNVQRLGLSVLCDIEDIPPCLFSSQTLTHLKLSVCPRGFGNTLFPKNLNLPALTCLHLEFLAFCAGDNGCVDPFSTFNRLNSLVIYSCYVKDAPTLCISSATLVNFTMHSHSRYFYKIELCTPCLCNFAFSGTPCQQLCGSNLSCVKQVDIDVDSYYKPLPFLLLTWLLELDNVKSLTVSASILQVTLTGHFLGFILTFFLKFFI